MPATPKPLSLAALWRDTLADTRALLPLALPVAAAFVLLPGVAIDLFGPPLPMPVAAAPQRAPVRAAAAASSDRAGAGQTATAVPTRAIVRLPDTATRPLIPAGFTANVVLIDLVVPALVGLIAQLAILRLALDRRRGLARSVGEALAAAFRAWPFAVVALLLCAGPVALGMLALIVPGLYLAGRLTPAVALVVDGTGPVAAVEASWALTAGNGWRVIGFTAMIVGWFFIVSAIGGAAGAGAVALLGAAGAGGAGVVVASAIDGLVAALFTVANAVAVATVYRLLKSA